jgi:hypothetical protein
MRIAKHCLKLLLSASIFWGCSSEDPSGPIRVQGTIVGRVIAGAGAQPVENAVISTMPVTANNVSASDGTFSIPNVPPGAYVVTALRPSGGTGSTSVVVQSGRQVEAVILMQADSATFGSIGGTIVGANGQPIPDAAITTTPATTSVRSSASGSFLLERLTPQAYVLRVAKAGFADAIISVNVVAEKRTTVSITLEADVTNPLPNVGTVRGTVRDQAGALLRDVMVSIDELNLQTVTGQSGQYEFNDVPVGLYRLRFRKSGHADVEENASVTRNGITIVNAVLASVSDPNADFLIGLWPFDGDARLTYGGLSSGEVVGAVGTSDRRGQQNRALAFNGESYVRIPHHPRLNELPLTVSFWMRSDAWPSFTVVVGKFQHPVGEGWDVFVEGAVFGAAFLRNDYRQYSRANGARPASGRWMHVCATYSTTGSSIYLNGTRTASANWTGTPSNTTSIVDVFVGRVPSSVTGFTGFRGAIDDLRIYSKTLSGIEIQALASAP